MKIGIIGLGVVGSAIKYGFEKLGHTISLHDKKFDSTIDDVISSEICFICVPTPSNADGSCNTAIVESVVEELVQKNYAGIIAIKSTVTPGTTQKLINKFNSNLICFVPEFLRERCATSDFVEKHDLLVIGTDDDEVFLKVRRAHGKLPKQVDQLPPTEAEVVKYFNNIYNATLIVFANSMYEICKGLGINYTSVKDTIVKRDHINDIYLDCNENFRGFGGMCLPKDTAAFAHLANKLSVNAGFFADILKENSRFKTTVLPGMRAELETRIIELDKPLSELATSSNSEESSSSIPLLQENDAQKNTRPS